MKILLIKILGIIWAFTIFLIFFQAWVMSGLLWFIPLAILTSIGFYMFWWHGYKKYKKGTKWAKLLFNIFTCMHFVPLVLQISGVFSPSWDKIILAIFGLFLLGQLNQKE